MLLREHESTRALRARLEAGLRERGAMDAGRFARFVAAQRELGLVQGDRPLCRHLRPYLLDSAAYRHIARSSELVLTALERLAARSRTDPQLARTLGMSAEEYELAAIDPGYPALLGVGRMDMLVSEEGLHFIELNADSPAGITDQLLLQQAFTTLPHLGSLFDSPDVYVPVAHGGLLRVVADSYAAWGGAAVRPSLAIVDWATAETTGEFRVLARLFEAAGYTTGIVDPRELTYAGGRLYAGAEAVDIVYRRVIVEELIARAGLEHPLIRAYRDRAVCIVNSFRTKALNKKAAFALLSDPAFGSLFTDEERAAIAATIPWTRLVAPGETMWRGRRVDLLELVGSEREHFVLKPNDDYGGRGVLLGTEASDADWARALAGAATETLIVQERKTPRTLRMPTFDDRVVEEQLYFDLCPFLFGGRMEGIMMRLSSSAVTNVSTGGGVCGVVVLGDGNGLVSSG